MGDLHRYNQSFALKLSLSSAVQVDILSSALSISNRTLRLKLPTEVIILRFPRRCLRILTIMVKSTDLRALIDYICLYTQPGPK